MQDPEYWRKFNTPSINDPDRRMLYHGMFMATDRRSMLQYWRENLLIDFDVFLRRLECPVLDINAISPSVKTPEVAREKHLAAMNAAGAPENVQTIFFYETRHFVMEDRHELLDRVVAEFVAGRDVADFRPNATNGE